MQSNVDLDGPFVSWVTPYVKAPGLFLRAWMGENGLTVRALTKPLGINEPTVARLLNGLTPLTPGIAIDLEDLTGVSARRWLEAEACYQVGLLRGKTPRRWPTGD